MRPKRLAVAAAVALLLCGVPSTALAETDIVLDNETSDTEVHTGDSSFSNNNNTSVGSGVSADEASSSPGIASQGLSATQPLSSVVDVPAETTPTVEKTAAPAAQTNTTEEVLFVGFPISTSVAP